MNARNVRHFRQPSLTELAKQRVASVLRNGSIAIDATMGNGHDTLFLARCVAPTGHVHAFDIQSRALATTRQRLSEARLERLVTMHGIGHQDMGSAIPPSLIGRVDAVMFNLGYLPGGDKTLVTRPDTTRQALTAACKTMRPTGLLSVMVYRHHLDAKPEVEAVRNWLSALPEDWDIAEHDSPGPLLYLVTSGTQPRPEHEPAIPPDRTRDSSSLDPP